MKMISSRAKVLLILQTLLTLLTSSFAFALSRRPPYNNGASSLVNHGRSMLTSLAMIPNNNKKNSKRSKSNQQQHQQQRTSGYHYSQSNHTKYASSTTFLDATKRGGGQSQRRDGEALSPPTTTSKKSNDTPSSSIKAQLSALTSKLSTITKPLITNKKAQGRIILLFVSFLYGTLNVSLRGIYGTDGAPVASVLSLVRQCLSVLSFIPIIMAANNNSSKGKEIAVKSDEDGKEEGVRPMWMSALELALWNFGAQV